MRLFELLCKYDQPNLLTYLRRIEKKYKLAKKLPGAERSCANKGLYIEQAYILLTENQQGNKSSALRIFLANLSEANIRRIVVLAQ